MEPRPGYFQVRVDVDGYLLRSLRPSEPGLPEVRSRADECSALVVVGATPGRFELPDDVDLGFSGGEGMSDEDLRMLVSHPVLRQRLTTFTWPSFESRVTDEACSILTGFDRLQTLWASGRRDFSGRGLSALHGLRFLTWFRGVDLSSLHEVAARCPLEELELHEVEPLDDEVFRILGKSRTLRQVTIHRSAHVTDAALDGLCSLNRLHWLAISGQPHLTTAAAIRFVRAVPVRCVLFHDCPGIEFQPVVDAAPPRTYVSVGDRHTEERNGHPRRGGRTTLRRPS